MTTTDTAARPGRVLTVMCAGMFLVLLDVTAVNVALPRIESGLGLGVSALQWVVDGYAVAIAGLLLAGGSLGDRLGHRRVLLGGFALFGLASLACALAPNGAMLVAARVAQGAGGALLLPSTMAVIAQAYPEHGAQARALGVWASISSLALPAGPLLGGVLVGSIGWRWVFWLDVPLVAAALAASLRLVARDDPDPVVRARRFDMSGLCLLVLGLAATVFAVIAGGHHAPAVEIGVAAVLAAIGLGAGVRVERRAEHPVLPVDLLRHAPFLGPNVVALTMNLVFNGLLFVATLYLQDVRGWSPLLSGTGVLPLAVPLVLLAPVSGRITAARGPRAAVVAGTLVAAAGSLLLLGLDVHGGTAFLLVGFGLLGCGAGLVTASVVAAVVRATPADRPGLATAMSNTARQTGTASGVAVFGAVAGSTSGAGSFVAAIHHLAVVACVLWLAASLVAARTIATGRTGQPAG